MKSLKSLSLTLTASLLLIAVMALFITGLTGFSYGYSFIGLLFIALIIKTPKGVALETVVKPLTEQLAEMKTSLENQLTVKAKSEVEAQIKSFETNIKELENKVGKEEFKSLNDTLTEVKKLADELKEWRVKKDEADKKNQEWIDNQVKRNKRGAINSDVETKSFNTILGEAVERHADAIRNIRPLPNGNSQALSFPLFTEDEMKSIPMNSEGKQEVKAVGDMSITANFPAATQLYQDVRGPLIETPYNRIYVADLLPNSTSTGTQVVYPKENGGEGGVAAWTDTSADKANMDLDLTSMTAPFEWLAGTVTVFRSMLDDISWLREYLQSRMLISLKNAETDMVLNGTANVQGFQQLASPYNGTMTNPVDRIIDAALGQIPDATNEFYEGNLVIARKRDLITKLGLNKASGSGEYDLPAGTVSFVNGRIQIGTLQAVGTTKMAWDTFYAADTNTTAFIRRLAPELRVFEDATLAKKNKLMFRIEERATLVVFRNDAIIKGVLQTS